MFSVGIPSCCDSELDATQPSLGGTFGLLQLEEGISCCSGTSPEGVPGVLDLNRKRGVSWLDAASKE